MKKLFAYAICLILASSLAAAQMIGEGVFRAVPNTGGTFLKAVVPLLAYPASVPSNTAASYHVFASQGPAAAGFNSVETSSETVVAASGTISNLIAIQPSWATGQWVLTLFKNGSATALTVTINSTSVVADNTHSVSVTAGDRLTVQLCPGSVSGNTCTAANTPTQATMYVSALWTSSIGQEGTIQGVPASSANLIANDFIGLGTISAQNATESIVSTVVPTSGTIDNLYFNIKTTPGAGNTWTATVFHETAGNCGTGAASSLSATIINGSTQASDLNAAHSFSVAAGDCISVQITSSGTPAASPGSVSVRWKPTTNYEAPLFSIGTTVLTTASGTRFPLVSGVNSGTGSTTEAAAEIILPNAGFSSISASKFYYLQSATAGGSTARAWTLRSGTPGGSNSSVSPTCSQSTGSASCASSDSSTLTGGNLINYQYTNGTGTINSTTWTKHALTLTVN